MSDLMAGKVVVVTGGAAGIGRATAVAFTRQGASVVIGDIDGAGAKEIAASIRDNGGEASSVRVDVTNSAEVQRMIASTVDRYDGLDYAFNNAGFVGSTAGIALGRWCEPEEVANVVVFLCSDWAFHVTGHVMPIDGGWTAR
jgi:NAD(P)-dependent dehydrogenase (short-subunit alcohol dehydrogenase family)